MNSWKKKSSNASNASNFWQTRYLFHNGTKIFLKLLSFPFFSKILRDIFSFSYLIKSDCLFMSQAVYCVFVLDTPASTIKLSAMLPHQRRKQMSQPLNSNKTNLVKMLSCYEKFNCDFIKFLTQMYILKINTMWR